MQGFYINKYQFKHISYKKQVMISLELNFDIEIYNYTIYRIQHVNGQYYTMIELKIYEMSYQKPVTHLQSFYTT